MNLLIDIAPKTVIINKQEYEINSNFRNSILFEELMQDINIKDSEKLFLALSLYYPVVPDETAEAVEKMLWFYKCGKLEVEDKSNEEQGSDRNSSKQVYSFKHDASTIYAAFLAEYHIDLQDIKHLHWWKFKALFSALKDDNQIVKIMGYRAMTITSDMSKEEKRKYRKLKELYALPDNRTVAEKEADFHNSLASIV